MRRAASLPWLAAAAILAVFAACDPVHEQQKNSLAGNAPGVRNGPLHRPGEPCLVCHDGAFGDPSAFSMAGTIYVNAGSTTPLEGATVSITSADGTVATFTTNAAGNFYANANQYTPKYPLHTSVTSGGTTVKMTSHVGGNGSCAFCHADPAGPSSPGHIYFDVPNGIAP